MYSRVKVLGHPLHPMLVSYPIALYTSTLAAYIIFVWFGHGDYFWLKAAVAANAAGVIMAVLTAVPGVIDWLGGIPQESPAKRHGLIHLALNSAALVLFAIDLAIHLPDWTPTIHPHTAVGAVLALLGVLCTVAAGFFGWTMVQDDHVGVAPLPMQPSRSRSRR